MKKEGKIRVYLLIGVVIFIIVIVSIVDPEDIYLIQYDGDGGERYIYINFKGKNYGLNNNAESDNKIIQKVIDAIDGGYNALDD